VNSGTDWTSAVGLSATFASPPSGRPTANKIVTANQAIGLFSSGSEGNAFENAPAAASGVVPIYMDMGIYELFVFETNGLANDASILSSYTIGAALYCSAWGFLTVEAPVTAAASAAYLTAGTANNIVVGTVTKVPTASDLSLGVYWRP
jgi:hypothetical protein